MKKNNTGFTLVELMVVVAIIGILAAFAYPSYTSYMKRGYRADAIDSMLSLAARMEEYYMNSDTYVAATVNATCTGTVGCNTTSDGLYTLSLLDATGAGSPDNFGYMIKATPTGADPDCGYLTLNSLGQKGVEIGTVAGCW